MIVPARLTEDRPPEPRQTIQRGRLGRPRGLADRIDTTASVKASEQPDSDRNSSASFVEIVGLRQRRLICSGCKCLLAPNNARIIDHGPVI